MIIVCVSYYSYWFFAFGCELINLEQLNGTLNRTEYYPFYNSFGMSNSFFYFQIISRCTRDFICNLILCVLNVLTLDFLRKQLKVKKNLTSSSSQASLQTNSDVARAEKVQSKLNPLATVGAIGLPQFPVQATIDQLILPVAVTVVDDEMRFATV